MAEEVNYASVVFKNRRPKAEKKEEIVYDNVKINSKTTEKPPVRNAKKEDEIVYDEVRIHSETTEKHPDTNAGLLTEKEAERGHQYKKLAYCFGTFCLILLLGIIGLLSGVFIYIASIHDLVSQLDSNQTALQEENYNLNSHINNLTSEKDNLTRSLKDVTDQLNDFKSLNKSRSLLREEMTNLTVKRKNLTDEKKNLETQNLCLEAKRKNLTGQNQKLEAQREDLSGQIKNMTAETIKFNTSRAQWSINAYCPKDKERRTCQACEKGWMHSQSNCYAVNDPEHPGQRNWTEAQKDCRGKGSDLVVVADVKEKKKISDHYNWASSGHYGYWIGLRAEHGKWKWVDGSEVMNISWITDPANDGRCVISVKDQGWKSVGCDEKQRWICGKAALSV